MLEHSLHNSNCVTIYFQPLASKANMKQRQRSHRLMKICSRKEFALERVDSQAWTKWQAGQSPQLVEPLNRDSKLILLAFCSY